MDQIRRLPPSWWQRASERFSEEFDAPLEGESKHHPVNRRLFRANTWLRLTVKRYVVDDGVREIPKGEQ